MLILKPNVSGLKKAREILKNGGIIIYPTDTLYGFGADIFCEKAVKKIFEIKKRSFKKPISILLSNTKEIKKFAYLNEKQKRFIQALLPGPFTVILKSKKVVPKILTGGTKKIGIRVVDSEICKKLSKNLPITTTSVNVSKKKPLTDVKKIIKKFNNKVEAIIIGKKLKNKPSTVIDLTVWPVKILRQ